MHCKSCKEHISSQFHWAINQNICPKCGLELIDSKLKDVFFNLKTVLSDASEYMDQIEDWLFSNYSLKKIKPNEVVVDKDHLQKNTHNKREYNSPGTMVNRNNDDQSAGDNKSIFAKRAGVPDHHKKALDFIKGKPVFGAADPSEFQGTDDEYGDVELEGNTTPLNAREAKQMSNLFDNEDNSSHELEMQKLKKLHSQNAVNNGGGIIRRGE